MDIEIKKIPVRGVLGSDLPVGSVVLDGVDSAYIKCKNRDNDSTFWLSLRYFSPCGDGDNRVLNDRLFPPTRALLQIDAEGC